MLRISDTIRATTTADGGVLMDVHRGQMFCLNVVGAKVLGLMQKGYDESRVADEISRDYGVNEEIVRRDVIEFIKSLKNNHILQSLPTTDAV